MLPSLEYEALSDTIVTVISSENAFLSTGFSVCCRGKAKLVLEGSSKGIRACVTYHAADFGSAVFTFC